MEIKEVTLLTHKYQQKVRFDLLPFGDMQVGSPLFNKQIWANYVAALKAAKNPITIGMGDYTDHFRPSVQERLTGAIRGYDSESLRSIQDMHREFIDRNVYPRLKDVVANSSCLGLLAGHHDMEYNDGTNSTQYLCQRLKVPYLGRGEALVRVNIQLSGTNPHKALGLDLYATHGEGKGSSAGTPILKLQKLLAYFDVDIVLRGHSCDRFIFQEPQYSMTRTHPPRLRCRNRMIANTGSFSESRIEGEATYVEKANMPPKALGWVEIHIHIKRDYKGLPRGSGGRGSHYIEIGD